MDASELARWSRFAVKGGIGKCTATHDCVAQNPEDLMFLQDDEIVVLMQVSTSDGIYLGFCEGVVGKFSGADVKFHGKLKKPVFARRPGSVTASAHSSPALAGRTIVSSPTPSDPSSSPFHLDKNDSELDINTIEQGPSEQSHSHSHHDTPPTYGHGYPSRSNTRASSVADKSPDSGSPLLEIPARRSDDQQNHSMTIEVVDERGQITHPTPIRPRHGITSSREEKGSSPVPQDPALTASRHQNLVSTIDNISGPGRDSISHARDSTDPRFNEGEQHHVIREGTVPTRPLEDGALEHDTPSLEPYSPSSQYTKEGGASEDSHIHRTSALTVSDGGFGIGLSLLQGLANGDRDSRNWSESETDIESSFPKPPTQTYPHFSGAAAKADQRVSTSSNGPAPDGTGRKDSAHSESDGGEGGFQWDDDDLLDDYRYSRYSLASKTSKQSRSSTVPSVTRPFQGVPPLPEDGRPSLDGQSSTRSAPSPSPQIRSGLLAPTPLNIVKNSSREATPLASPTTPVPHINGSDTGGWTQERATSSLSSSGRRQASNDDEHERPSSAGRLKLPRSEDKDITPKPSSENLTLQTNFSERFVPSTSNDYNGDESEFDETDADPVTITSPDALSPSSTAGSTSSLFLPHPGAPKPVMNNKGQIAPRAAAIHIATAAAAAASQPDAQVGSPSDPQRQVRPGFISIPTAVSLLSTLAMAAERARNVKQTTVYGTTHVDLLSSSGPVPIAFSLEGHPPSPRTPQDPDFGFPRQSPTFRGATGSPGPGVQFPGGDGETSPSQVQPIPRANFFPSNGRPRPRSRSFSGFSLNDSEVLIPITRSGEVQPRGPNMTDYRTSLRGTSPVPAPGRSSTLPSAPIGQIRSRSPSRGPSRAQRPTHVPSPLSLPAINNTGSISLPSVQHNGSTADNSKAGLGSLKKKGLRQVSSSGGLRLGGGGHNERLRSPPEQSSSRPSSDRREISPQKRSPRRSISQSMAQVTSFDDGERSELSTPSLIPPGGGSSSSSSSPMARSASLRSKLSISALRSRGSNPRRSRDGNDAPFSSLPLTNPGFGNDEEERVQIKDMEFELVKPIIKTSGIRVSEDTGSQAGSPGETESIRSGLDGQGSAWRAESPSTSPATSFARSPKVHNSVDSFANLRNASAIQIASIEAHRLREQRWMTLISTVPSTQARKSKKIKKLLLEGVPSSVRGRVWGHITDSKARRMEGLFEQLVKKAPQALVPIVEQDVERCFPDHPHLQDPQGCLASLILAYTAMVPDIRYRNGLTRIAGHLLLQAPDEDAFWIFVAVMDSHLRGYYHATNTGQFEIDASLFQTLVESVEPELAQVLFNDIGLRAVDICGSWFSCLFAGVLPPDHLYRIWDMLLYEGPIYLFRVALALITLCKRPIMTMNLAQAGRGPVIELLGRPPLSAIPQDPESFISHTFTVKVRDDDLRKQRLKREAQWKKDRLAQR